MNMPEFKALPIEEQLTRLNKHLLMIKDLPGRLEDNFKSGDFEFSYSLLKKDAPKLGITVDGKNYVAFKTGEEPQQNDVKKQQETKKTEHQILEKQTKQPAFWNFFATRVAKL